MNTTIPGLIYANGTWKEGQQQQCYQLSGRVDLRKTSTKLVRPEELGELVRIVGEKNSDVLKKLSELLKDIPDVRQDLQELLLESLEIQEQIEMPYVSFDERDTFEVLLKDGCSFCCEGWNHGATMSASEKTGAFPSIGCPNCGSSSDRNGDQYTIRDAWNGDDSDVVLTLMREVDNFNVILHSGDVITINQSTRTDLVNSHQYRSIPQSKIASIDAARS